MKRERFINNWLWLGGMMLILLLAGLSISYLIFYQPVQAGSAQPEILAAAGQITADIGRDKLEASGFSPNASVTFTLSEEVSNDQETILFGPYTVPTDGTGFADVPAGLPGDVVAGQLLRVVDDATEQEKELTLADIAILSIDSTRFIIEGSAPAGTDLTLNGYNAANAFDSLFFSSELTGAWTADFGSSSILPFTRFTLFLQNEAGDTTAYSATIEAADARIEASLSHDLLTGINFSPEAEVAVELLSGIGGKTLFGPTIYSSDESGRFTVRRQELSLDLVPGQQVIMRDGPTGRTKQLTIEPITIDSFDPQTDVVTGRSDPGATLFVDGIGPSGNTEQTIMVDANGIWTINFQALGQSDVERVFAIRLDPDNDGSTAFFSPTFPTSTPIPSVTPTGTPSPTATVTPTPSPTPTIEGGTVGALDLFLAYIARPQPAPVCDIEEVEPNDSREETNINGQPSLPTCAEVTATGFLPTNFDRYDIFRIEVDPAAFSEMVIRLPVADPIRYQLDIAYDNSEVFVSSAQQVQTMPGEVVLTVPAGRFDRGNVYYIGVQAMGEVTGSPAYELTVVRE